MSFSIEHHASKYPTPDTPSTRLFVFVGGTSESGKSELTTIAHQRGDAHRIKYLRVANELSAELYGTGDPFEFLNPNHEHSEMHHALFWQRLESIVEAGPRIAFIETIKHPELLRSFGRAALDAKLYTIFIDADFDQRVEREAARLGVNPEHIRQYISEKDALKQSIGLEGVRGLADATILNNGSHDEYVSWAHALISEFTERFESTSQDSAILFE